MSWSFIGLVDALCRFEIKQKGLFALILIYIKLISLKILSNYYFSGGRFSRVSQCKQGDIYVNITLRRMHSDSEQKDQDTPKMGRRKRFQYSIRRTFKRKRKRVPPSSPNRLQGQFVEVLFFHHAQCIFVYLNCWCCIFERRQKLQSLNFQFSMN